MYYFNSMDVEMKVFHNKMLSAFIAIKERTAAIACSGAPEVLIMKTWTKRIIGISCAAVKDEKLIVELKILIRFGTSIRNTSEQLLREIKDEIESKCGIEISNVDIAVQGMYSGRKMNYTKH